jgi:hypothetical protein
MRALVTEVDGQRHVGGAGGQGAAHKLRSAAGKLQGGVQPPLQGSVAVQLTGQGGEAHINTIRLQPPAAVTAGPVHLGTDPAGGPGQAQGLQLDPVGGNRQCGRRPLLPGAVADAADLRLLHPALPLTLADPALEGEAGRAGRPPCRQGQAVAVHRAPQLRLAGVEHQAAQTKLPGLQVGLERAT